MQIDIRPFVASFEDYHNFYDMVFNFEHAGVLLEYKEIGCGKSDKWLGARSGYHAVFWVRGCSEEEKLEVEELYKEYKEII